ncbi:MAG: hypothetical protein V3U54_08830 [Thermodesulfobacteriota bacterium]
MTRLFFEDLAEARAEVGKLLYNIIETPLDIQEKRDIAMAYVLLKNLERKRQGVDPITVDTVLKVCYTKI